MSRRRAARAGSPQSAALEPAEERQALQAIAGALGLELRADELAGLQTYLALLRRWNATYNLTAVRESAAMLTQHIADCLAAVAALERSGIAPAGAHILDAGSGGGLPGVLLALRRREWRVTCVDAAAKKAAFVQQVAGSLGLVNLDGRHGRVEALKAEPFDLVMARAFASLAELVRLTSPLLRSGGCWIAMKGHVPAAEVTELPAAIDVFHVEPLQVPGLEAQRCLVWMRRRSDIAIGGRPAPGPAGAAAGGGPRVLG